MTPLAELLSRAPLPNRDALAELDGYRSPVAGKATAPVSRARGRRTSRLSRLACERGSATVASLGAGFVGASFVVVVLRDVAGAVSHVLEVLPR